MKNIVKSELINKTWKTLDKKFRKSDIETIINAFIKNIAEEIKNESKVKIDGLGTFSSFIRKSYTGKNLKGEIEDIPSTKYITFKPSKKLKE